MSISFYTRIRHYQVIGAEFRAVAVKQSWAGNNISFTMTLKYDTSQGDRIEVTRSDDNFEVAFTELCEAFDKIAGHGVNLPLLEAPKSASIQHDVIDAEYSDIKTAAPF